VHENVRHVLTRTTHTSMLASAREGKYDTMKIVISSVREEIQIRATVEQCQHGEKMSAIGADKTAIDKEMMRLMGLIK